MNVQSSLGDLMSTGEDAGLVMDSNESQVISSTKSEALQALLSGNIESPMR